MFRSSTIPTSAVRQPSRHVGYFGWSLSRLSGGQASVSRARCSGDLSAACPAGKRQSMTANAILILSAACPAGQLPLPCGLVWVCLSAACPAGKAWLAAHPDYDGLSAACPAGKTSENAMRHLLALSAACPAGKASPCLSGTGVSLSAACPAGKLTPSTSEQSLILSAACPAGSMSDPSRIGNGFSQPPVRRGRYCPAFLPEQARRTTTCGASIDQTIFSTGGSNHCFSMLFPKV